MLLPACCPMCGSKAVVRHCDSSTCTWLRCHGCDKYGTADGARSAPVHQQKQA